MEAEARRDIQLESSWLELLEDEFAQDYMRELRRFLREEKAAGKEVYPPGPLIFNALNSLPFDRVRVVILGQDPYHGPGQAHGLCFSVQRGVPVPPSLGNIYKELHDSLGLAPASHGCLENWARQGVLLLNAVLTVERGKPGSHRNKGWERFTDRIVSLLNDRREGLVFLLWGSYAQEKGRIINQERHLVLASPHPSPFSAHRGFLGNRHFVKANDYLGARGIGVIDWRVDQDGMDDQSPR